ncbi:MAG: transposase [Bacteroidetes bacterium]|nr:transposase [Bacteroidota bacterium]
MLYAREHPDFITATCLDWKPILSSDRNKDIIIESMRFLTRSERLLIYAFVLMNNHIHIIWQMLGAHKRSDVQRDFLRFTSQRILEVLKADDDALYDSLIVNAKDRKRQVWKRNALSISLWTPKVFDQKLDYIHDNPVRAGLCKYPEDYKYSSAGFYLCNRTEWDFLSHANG